MKLNFTLEQMLAALNKAGYEIKEESVRVNEPILGNSDREVSHKVYRVLYCGKDMAEWAGYGTNRVTYVFNRELEKKLLELF